ncbi:zinc-binding dehydrogenase [Streptomyces litchfieldiae]|uniref:Zinc-binding dehydrogenase n=1 Tax=Streptomyces litchfieldiae TaxID=3075543 RepID=A0ABU2MXK6_9ACTN|nr:zinc-binding dehydrogenase [Streptomyces sp. DSM 44938]MDT0346398.1 zinc-binding dehydrogenase [Streptomyces sp. DSM 44938]
MRVAQVTRFGGPEVIEAAELPDPVPGPGEVVIRVAAADTIFVETQIRAGWNADSWGMVPPYVPGGAVAGVVTATGAGVDPSWTGRPVAAHTRPNGGYAEQALVPAQGLIPLPRGLDAETAAALMHDGPTALGLFTNARVRAGESVLILPAAGGASSLLVQLAKAAGAHVTGAARGRRKLDAVRELGADTVVDYAEPGWLDGLRADVIFEGVGGELGAGALRAAAAGARVAAYGAPSGEFSEHDPAELERRGIRLSGIEQVQFAPDELKEITARALTEAAAGRIRPLIAQRLPLERAAEAHAAIESRSVVGKILLVP